MAGKFIESWFMQSQGILTGILNHIPNGVMILDKEGNISYVNSTYCALVGYNKEELVGLSHREAVKLLLDLDAENYGKVKKNFYEVLNGKSFFNKRKLKHKQGSYVPVQQFIAPITDEMGEVIGCLFIYKDLHYELLLEISHAVNSSLNIETIIENAVNSILEHLGLSSTAIFLYDEEKKELALAACNLTRNEDFKYFRHKLGEGAPGIIAAEKRPLYIRDMKTYPLIHPKVRETFQNKSSIGFPLVCKDELVGVIAYDAFTVRDFTTQELFLFESIANQLALAIYNAKLYDITRKISITDGLTGIYNHHYFQKRLEEELNRSKRNLKPLSLLMIDLDNFKDVNDCFGHPEGDKVLKQVAEVLKKNVRTSDVICRYGGEEFAVILTECDIESALKFSERIRSTIEQLKIGIENKFMLTASIGLASYPVHALDNSDLILAADKALYKSKKLKNKVSVAEPLKKNRDK